METHLKKTSMLFQCDRKAENRNATPTTSLPKLNQNLSLDLKVFLLALQNALDRPMVPQGAKVETPGRPNVRLGHQQQQYPSVRDGQARSYSFLQYQHNLSLGVLTCSRNQVFCGSQKIWMAENTSWIFSCMCGSRRSRASTKCNALK